MKIIETALPGVIVLEPKVFGDSRGFFFESFQKQRLQDAGITHDFVQDNVSRSSKHVLRGLHYQLTQPQGKLVSVSRGAVYDVVVDICPNSPTFKQYIAVTLSDENHHLLYVPPGYAHGFSVLSDVVDYHYKCTDYYAPEDERGVLWNDPEINIPWPLADEPILSVKDAAFKPLAELDTSELPPCVY